MGIKWCIPYTQRKELYFINFMCYSKKYFELYYSADPLKVEVFREVLVSADSEERWLKKLVHAYLNQQPLESICNFETQWVVFNFFICISVIFWIGLILLRNRLFFLSSLFSLFFLLVIGFLRFHLKFHLFIFNQLIDLLFGRFIFWINFLDLYKKKLCQSKWKYWTYAGTMEKYKFSIRKRVEFKPLKIHLKLCLNHPLPIGINRDGTMLSHCLDRMQEPCHTKKSPKKSDLL